MWFLRRQSVDRVAVDDRDVDSGDLGRDQHERRQDDADAARGRMLGQR